MNLDLERIKELYDDWDMCALAQGPSAEGKAWDFMDEVPELIAEVETLRKALDQAIEFAGPVEMQMGPQDMIDYPELAAYLKSKKTP